MSVPYPLLTSEQWKFATVSFSASIKVSNRTLEPYILSLSPSVITSSIIIKPFLVLTFSVLQLKESSSSCLELLARTLAELFTSLSLMPYLYGLFDLRKIGWVKKEIK